MHWFMIPLTLCGIVISIDAINWLRGRYGLFDPIGILGLLGVYFFYVTPLLIVAWGYQLLYLPPLDDFRPWLGYMGILNFLGLMIYRFTRNLFKPASVPRKKTTWQIEPRRFSSALFYALVITGVLQIWVYIQFGGIGGYLSTFDEFATTGTATFSGLGPIFFISESFPFLLLMAFAVNVHRKGVPRSWLFLTTALIIFLIIRFLFGGLRGSRSNTIWALFWAVGLIHLWIRPVPRKLVMVGVVFTIVFMYLFGFFKSLGSNFGRVFESSTSLTQLEKETNRSFQVMAVSDLGRADIQAYLLYRLARPESDYLYAWGRTYIGGLLSPVPGGLWPGKPLTKVKEGTEALRGRGWYDFPGFRASNIYGLAGEAMLNFTPFSIPISFAVLGWIVARVRHWLLSWDISDSRILLVPIMIVLCFFVLINDLDNNVIYIIQYGLIPSIVIWLGSSRKVITGTETAR